MHKMRISLIGIFLLHFAVLSDGNPDAKRLYDEILSGYNKLVRPVKNVTDPVTVKFKLKLSQLIDVNLRNQIMTTNLWVEQFWYDHKLVWEPEEFGGVDMLHVPSTHIWLPDIVLYNNADGNFEVTLATKATLYNNGLVEWKPPAIYHSSCEMDVEYFPFDEQTCVMKFGSWTYDGFQVDLRHQDAIEKNKDERVRVKSDKEVRAPDIVEIGIDLKEFYKSVEWDILGVPASRNVKFYTCCDEPYLDITFNITMRRKTLFYTVNLIIPCMGISFLTVLVFYLPSDSGEKVSLSISILLSLTVFFLLLAEIIPPTSLVVPLLGKFVLFTMILDTFSICVTVVVLNVHFRSPQTHLMSPWVRRVFIHLLPRLLVMKRPLKTHQGFIAPIGLSLMQNGSQCNGLDIPELGHSILKKDTYPLIQKEFTNYRHGQVDHKKRNGFADCRIHGSMSRSIPMKEEFQNEGSHSSKSSTPSRCSLSLGRQRRCPELERAMESANYMAECTKNEQESDKVREDWKFVAMVLDRLFLWIFSVAVVVGTAGIILQAPSLYDLRPAIDEMLSEIEAVAKPMANDQPGSYL